MDNPLPYLGTIGLQLWSVRDQMEKDPELTLKTIKDLGYYQVEGGDTRILKDIKSVCDDLDLKIHSSFINWNTITGGWKYTPDDTPFEFAEVLDQAGEAGLSHLVFGYLPPEERTSADDWKRLADQLNEAGSEAKTNGLQLTYHNHNFEWDPIEDTTGFNILMDRMDGGLVPFELDFFWAQIAGQDARETMTTVKDRLELLHLKQLRPGTPVITRLDDVPDNAYEELPDGDIPIKELIHYGKELGVKYCMVEQDGNYEGSSLQSAGKSLDFLMS
ncbi:MAG: sugar phosphate isomerase/epimerase [Lewinella sp.]|nr:sugar phosphate isomerase/epimerase [Lewinella sp.]